jgi:Protein of unknown function (DUF3108)
MHRWSLAIGLSFCAAVQAAPPARVEIASDVLYNGGVIGEVTHVLEHDGKAYRLTERTKGKGLFALLGEARRSSRGTIAANGLRPLEYEDVRTGRDPATARFAWDTKSVTLQFREGPQLRPLPAHAQDRLSFLFAFAFQSPGNQSIEFNVVDGKGIANYIFDVTGRERIKVPAGEFDAMRLAQRKEHAGDSSNEIWLDPSRSYLPLRVLVVQKDGTRIDQVATRVTVP